MHIYKDEFIENLNIDEIENDIRDSLINSIDDNCNISKLEDIDYFIEKLNCLEGIEIKRYGKIEDLSQQDYNGKRVYIQITDRMGNFIDSKIDLGVHKHLEIEQEEYCFDIAFDDEGVSLLANTREQMFAEKLRSLLKFGSFSTRYKDIYDMYYQCGKMNEEKLFQCL